MKKSIKNTLILAVTGVLAACNGGGGSGSYQTKPNNLPRIYCSAYAFYSVDPANTKGDLQLTPILGNPTITDSYVIYSNEGNGYLGAGLSQMAGNPLSYDYFFDADTENTTPSTPYPAGVCAMLKADVSHSLYPGAYMLWSNCQAPVENGIMNFSADYQIIESTGALITSGNLSFNCDTTESSNQSRAIDSDYRAVLRSFAKGN
jgi:hypothetical protein